MASQNINQYVYKKLGLNFALEQNDMSLASDEKDFNQEVVFSPYLIAQTYGKKLPVYFDIDSPLTWQPKTLNYKNYDSNHRCIHQCFSKRNERPFGNSQKNDQGSGSGGHRMHFIRHTNI